MPEGLALGSSIMPDGLALGSSIMPDGLALGSCIMPEGLALGSCIIGDGLGLGAVVAPGPVQAATATAASTTGASGRINRRTEGRMSISSCDSGGARMTGRDDSLMTVR